jgi:hypothetical protein
MRQLTNGFQLVGRQEKNRLFKQCWIVPERQIETSVVLANPNWWERGVKA